MAPYRGIALIVNAASDLGHAVAEAFVQAGCCRIILADKSLDTLEKTRLLLNGDDVEVGIVECIGNEANDYESMVQTAASLFNGTLNYCVNCSTIIKSNIAPTGQMDAVKFKAGLDDSSRALWLCLRAQVRQLLKQSESKNETTNAIVNVVPYGSLGSHPGHAIQAASGYQRIGITKSVARDHLKDGFRVNAVCPALTNSKEDSDGDTKILEEHLKISGRVIQVEEVANAAVFLAGELSQGINGISLPVDAGWSMYHS